VIIKRLRIDQEDQFVLPFGIGGILAKKMVKSFNGVIPFRF